MKIELWILNIHFYVFALQSLFQLFKAEKNVQHSDFVTTKLADEMPRTLVRKNKNWAGKPDISDEEREYIQHLHKAEELRHQEILFKIERYAISLFALFFLVFNAVYWTDLLYSAKFDER